MGISTQPTARTALLTALAAGLGSAALLLFACGLGGGLEPLARSSAAWLFLALTAAAAGAEALFSLATQSPPPSRRQDGEGLSRALAAVTGLLLLALTAIPMAQLGASPAPAIVAAGGLAMLAGAALRAAAIRRLGKRFTSTNAVVDGAALERGGAYRWLAHPSELGLLLLAAGGLLLVGQPVHWLGLALLYAVLVARVWLEERALAGVHGPAYRAYRAGTLDPIPTLIASGKSAP